MIASPAFPELPTIAFGRAEGLVSEPGNGSIFLPHAAISTDRNDWRGASRQDGGIATARIIRTVCRDSIDLLALWDLVQKVWQDRTVTRPRGRKLYRADVASPSIHR